MKVLNRSFLLTVVCLLVAFTVLPASAEQPRQQTAKSPALEGKININSATAEQLTLLPGIGNKTAGAIVQYRTKNGNYKSLEDLTGVKGIGFKTLEKIRVYLMLDGETTLAKK